MVDSGKREIVFFTVFVIPNLQRRRIYKPKMQTLTHYVSF
jgi:hypothetical protein